MTGQDPADDEGLERARQRIRQLEDALTAHAVIDQARGVLMARHQMDADSAWAVLVRVSSTTNIKVRVLATTVLALTTSTDPTPDSPAVAAVRRFLLGKSALLANRMPSEHHLRETG